MKGQGIDNSKVNALLTSKKMNKVKCRTQCMVCFN